jgi:hypothetical protein
MASGLCDVSPGNLSVRELPRERLDVEFGGLIGVELGGPGGWVIG